MPAASFVGIDRDSKAIGMTNKLASAARIANVTWEKTELDEFSGGKFDVVSALGLVESSPAPATFLARISRCSLLSHFLTGCSRPCASWQRWHPLLHGRCSTTAGKPIRWKLRRLALAITSSELSY